MNVGLIGLGKMGAGIAKNFLSNGFSVYAYDQNTEVSSAMKSYGENNTPPLRIVHAIEDFQHVPNPRAFWIMVPSGEPIDQVIAALKPFLVPGDIVMDGGNSHFKDSIRRASMLSTDNIHYLDAGVSGGVDGAEYGACLMVGGDEGAFKQVEPLIASISATGGYLYTGPIGSGHFLKMVHNGIEYGMMQAIAEGFDLLDKSPFSYDFKQVADLWNHGSVIRSWLIELLGNAFEEDSKLESIKGIMQSSGEGQWTVETALEYRVPLPVISMSLYMRYRSLETDTFSGKIVAALRNQFGGHPIIMSDPMKP